MKCQPECRGVVREGASRQPRSKSPDSGCVLKSSLASFLSEASETAEFDAYLAIASNVGVQTRSKRLALEEPIGQKSSPLEFARLQHMERVFWTNVHR